MRTIKEIVLEDQKDKAGDYNDYLQDVIQHGCVSGMVSGLIYYDDTRRFFVDHKEEINHLLTEILESTGLSVSELFGNKWDDADPLALDTQNQNLLVWFAYEETARAVLEEQGIEA